MEMTLTPASIAEFQKSLSVKGKSGQTIRAYVADLNGLLNWSQSSTQEFKTFEELSASYLNQSRLTQAAKTVNRKLATFRSFAKSHGVQALDEYVPPKPGKQHPHPLPEGVSGVDRMLDRAKSDDETAIVVLCGMVALRISEARKVKPSHFAFLNGTEPVLKVFGKGDKDRFIPVPPSAWLALQPLYERCRAHNMNLILLSDSGARRAWTRLGQRAELGRRTSSHDGRATKATHLFNSGVNPRVVQDILGHVSLETTQIYAGVTMRDMKEAMKL